MATLADIFIADPHSARSYPADPISFDRIELKRLTILELSILRSILLGNEWDVVSLDLFEPVFDFPGDVESINQLPQDLVQSLASTEGGKRVEEISRLWAETDELCCDPEEIHAILVDIIKLARQALQNEKKLFLWVSL